jgi:hypothetical protein
MPAMKVVMPNPIPNTKIRIPARGSLMAGLLGGGEGSIRRRDNPQVLVRRAVAAGKFQTMLVDEFPRRRFKRGEPRAIAHLLKIMGNHVSNEGTTKAHGDRVIAAHLLPPSAWAAVRDDSHRVSASTRADAD